MGKLATIKWPQEYSELERIEQLLLCGICYDYMDTSVMTPCSHNYCSLCIRKYLHYKTQCPACFEKTFEKDLHTNRILDELISYFGNLRLKLVDCVAGAKIETEVETNESPRLTTPVRPARLNQNQKKISSRVETKPNDVSGNSECKTEKQSAPVVDTQTEKALLSSPSTSGMPCKMATIFTPKSKKNCTSATSLPCPVCRVEISEINMNKHLDDCLKRDTVSQQAARVEPKRKPLPKLVFSLMKDTELRKKIKELGLPTQGDRKTLEARFQRYSTLYNAECDKKEPRTVQELIRQCDEEEALEKKMLKFSQSANRLKVNRNTEQNVIEEAQKKYLESNKKNYASLIAAIKERERRGKSSVRRSLVNRDVDDPSENVIPQRNLNDLSEDEDSNRSCYAATAYDTNFQDSDSDTSCPLQHYTSNGPTSLLPIAMSTSGNKSIDDSVLIPSKSSRNEKKSLDAEASPAKNVTLNNDNSALRNQVDNILETADTESNDEDHLIAQNSKPTATRRCTKRAKLSLRNETTANNANQLKNNQNRLEGEKLALSIARDFTFDTSSNDSLGNEATYESACKKPNEKSKVEAGRIEDTNNVDLGSVDKENEESCTTNSMTVNRPLRKRNCVTRAQSANEKTEDGPITVVSEEALRMSGDGKVESPSRVDSLVKRRRRRKIETPTASEANDPPSRPLRKRNTLPKG